MSRKGAYSLNGAGAGPALPTAQVCCSFVRGAGEQYGLGWIGNASLLKPQWHKGYGTPPPMETNGG